MAAESQLRNRRFSAKIELDPGHFGGIFWKNKLEVVGTCLAFWTFGVCIALLGPSLWDLGCQTGTSLSHMTWIFFVQTLFTMFGSFVGGMLLHSFKIDASLIILFSVILISCTLIVVPFCISIYHLVYSFAVMGMAMGLVDITATISLIKKFKMDASPFIQALYCCYGIGAFCSPLILRFFVKDFDCTTLLEKSSNATGRRWIISHQMHRKMIYDKKEEYEDLREIRASLRTKEGFFLLALLQAENESHLNTRLPSCQFYCTRENYNLPVITTTALTTITKKFNHHSLKHEGSVDDDLMAKSKQQNAKIYVISLSVALLFFSSGMEGTFGGLIFTFCKLVIPTIEAQEAANIDAIFWVSSILELITQTQNDIAYFKAGSDQPDSLKINIIRSHPFIFLNFGQLVTINFHSSFGQAAEAAYTRYFPPTACCSWKGFFALGRFGAIFAATSFSNGFILLCDTTGCLVSYCVLYTLQGSTIGLYCGVALFGLFLSTVSPTTISLTEQFFDIGPIATSCLVVGAGFGEMLYPVFMGNLLQQNNGPHSFLFGVLATIIIMQIVFICFWITGVRSRGFKKSSAGSMLFEFSKIPNDELKSNYELIPTDE